MAWLTPPEERRAMLLAIERALGTGALEVRYADKKVTYRDIAALQTQAHLLRESLGLTNQQQSGRPNQVRPVNDSGF